MKRVFLIPLMLVLAGALIFPGCARPAPTPSPGKAPLEVIELKLAHHNSPTAPIAVNGLNIYARMIEEATNHRVTVTLYPAQTLCKGADTYEAVTRGIAEIGWAYEGFFAGRFPLSSVMWLPCMGVPSSVIGGRILMDLYYKFPQLQAEYPGVKVLFLDSQTPAFVATSKKPVRTLEDLRGLKLRITGAGPTEFMVAQGVSPVSVGPGDMYTNMQKGVIDGYAIDWEGLDGYKMYDVTRYVTNCKWYVSPFFLVMNLDKWNSLPPDIQKAIDSVSGYVGARIIDKSQDDAEAPVRKKLADLGIEVIEPTPQELARWTEAAKPLRDKWIAEMEGKGLPGKAVYNEFVRLIGEYTK